MPPAEIKFDKGLNTGTNYLSMPPGACMSFQDMQLDYGTPGTRGVHKPISSASTLSGIRVAYAAGWISRASANGIPSVYVVTNGFPGTVFRSNTAWNDTFLTAPSAFTDVRGAVVIPSTVGSWKSDVLNDLLIFTTLENATPFRFASNAVNAVALGGTPPGSPDCIKSVNNYLFLSGFSYTGTSYARVYWSSIGDPETWPAANFVDFRSGDGDSIRALGAIGTDLFIFKSRGIAKLSTNSLASGPGPFSVIWDNLGAINGTSVDNINDGRLAFIGSDLNVYITDGYTLTNISFQAPDGLDIRSLLSGGSLSTTPLMWLKYYHQRMEIVISVPVSSYLLAYDIRQGYWRKITGITSYALGILAMPPGFGNGMGRQILLGGDATGSDIQACALMDDYTASATTLIDQTGATLTAEISTSVRLPENMAEFGVAGVTVFSETVASGAKIYIGYDNTYQATPTAIDDNTKVRYDLTEQIFPRSNNQIPASMQFKITSTSTGDGFPGIFVDSKVGS